MTYTERGYNEGLVNDMREKSISGTSSKRTGERISINRKKFRKAMSIIITMTFLAGGMTVGAADKLIDSARDNRIVNEMMFDLDEVVESATHRTDDGKNYWFDYTEIAEHLKEAEDFDQEVYLMYENFSSRNLTDPEDQIDQVLQNTKIGGFDEFLDSRGFSSVEEFTEVSRNEVLLEAKSIDYQEELNKLREAHPTTNGEAIKGENSL